jgi:hypothetical protein
MSMIFQAPMRHVLPDREGPPTIITVPSIQKWQEDRGSAGGFHVWFKLALDMWPARFDLVSDDGFRFTGGPRSVTQIGPSTWMGHFDHMLGELPSAREMVVKALKYHRESNPDMSPAQVLAATNAIWSAWEAWHGKR